VIDRDEGKGRTRGGSFGTATDVAPDVIADRRTSASGRAGFFPASSPAAA
jgi:hypothetical protein